MATSLENQTQPAECEKHGAFESRRFARTVWSRCPACLDEERNAAETAREAAREAQKHAARDDRIRGLRADSGLVGRQLQSSFDNFATPHKGQADILQYCRDYVGQFQREGNAVACPSGGVWLLGPPGCGKSHLGASMVLHLIDTLATPAYMLSVREIVRLLRSTWSKDNPPQTRGYPTEAGGYVMPQTLTEEMVIERLGGAALLVIDEIGVGFGSEAELVQLFDVLDLRYRNELPTVLLSNSQASEIKHVLGDRLYDRLREGSIAKACTWPSYRGEFSRLQGQKAA